MKKLSPHKRWLILGGLLAITVAAGMLAEEGPAPDPRRKRPLPGSDGPFIPVARNDGSETTGRAQILEEPSPLQVPPETLAIDPFRSKSWYVAPPPPPPPEPRAPALPFQYLGKLVEGGETKIFLARQGKNLIVRAGDVIDDTYAVQEISAGRLVFEYLPLKEKQLLSIGVSH